jgi:hypothetical protein
VCASSMVSTVPPRSTTGRPGAGASDVVMGPPGDAADDRPSSGQITIEARSEAVNS